MNKKIFGLLGRTLGHSYSPQIHKALGLPNYELFEIEPPELENFLRREELGAVNITIPYKKDACRICDTLTEAAKAIGSVNTVVRCPDGQLLGDNTDAYGFLYMANRANISFENRKVLILGNGGASLTAQYITKNQGAKEVIIMDRRGENRYETIHRHFDSEIIINATPVGMYPHNGESLIRLTDFPKVCGVLDMIYNPRRTALLLEAESLGIPCSDGLPMLVAQAKAAEERFFQKTISPEVIPEILGALRRERENIILIGMPGSGKTTVGKALAKLTERPWIDIDDAVEAEAAMTIPEIFKTCGEAHFRRLEQKKTAEFGAEGGKVIMTGGGVVKIPENAASLRQNGRIYWLQRDVAKLERKGRPLSIGSDLHAMLKEREPLYEKFCDAIITNDADAESIATQIWRDFCAYTRH